MVKNKDLRIMLVQRVIQMILSFIISIVFARNLGTNDYGIINYGLSIVSIFSSLCTLGINTIIVNELINKENEEKIVGSSIVLRLITSVISIVSIITFVLIFNRDNRVLIIVALIEALMIIFESFNYIENYFEYLGDFKKISIIKIVNSFVIFSYKILVVLFCKNIYLIALSFVLDALLLNLLFYINYHKKIVFDKKVSKEILLKGKPYLFSSLIVVIYTSIDKIMIGNILTNSEVGLYTIALVICGIWVFIADGIITYYRPKIMSNKKKNKNYLSLLKKTYASIFWIGVACSIIICLVSKPFIMFVYGEGYLKCVNVIMVGVWYTIFSELGVARKIWLVCENKNNYNAKILFIGVILNVILNYLFIFRYRMVGVIFATLLVQIANTFVLPLFFKETRKHVKILWDAILLKYS